MVNVVGTIKDVVLTYISLAVMDEYSGADMPVYVLCGLALSFTGASLSLRAKLKEVAQERQRARAIDPRKDN